MDRNDRNYSDNQRNRQRQQNFHRNPQRPPAPDYSRQQRDNPSFDRRDERASHSESNARMNPRSSRNTRQTERGYDLPDRPQSQRFSAQNVGDRSREGELRGAREADGLRRSNTSGNYQNSPSRRIPQNQQEPRDTFANRQREPLRDDRRNSFREMAEGERSRALTAELRRDGRRPVGRDVRQPQQNDRRFNAADSGRPSSQSRCPIRDSRSQVAHDDEYYSAPRAADPRRKADQYEGMKETGVDLGSFDINYKGDAVSPSSAPSGILGKPLLLLGFAGAALAVTVILFFVVSAIGKSGSSSAATKNKSNYEFKVPDSVTIGGTKIKTDTDYIDLAEMNLNEINDLSYCLLINSLFINQNQISDLSPIADCISIKTLDAGSNQISDIAALSHLNQLSDLNVSNNQITDISPLANLTQLETLDASRNRITDISPLANIPAFRQIILSDNGISDLRPLSDMTTLTTLELANNQISDISPISGMGNLSTLNLSGNNISDLKSLKALSSLTLLDLSGNPVSNVSALGNLKNLLELNLTGTKVSKDDLSDLKKALPNCRISK